MTFRLNRCSNRTLRDYLTRPEVAERCTGMTVDQLAEEAQRRGLLPPGWEWYRSPEWRWLHRPGQGDEAWSSSHGLWFEPGVEPGESEPATDITRAEAIARAWSEWRAGLKGRLWAPEHYTPTPAKRFAARQQTDAPDGVILDAEGLEAMRKKARDALAAELSEATVNVLVNRAGQGWHVRDLLTLVDDLASVGIITSGAVEEAKAAVFRAVRNYAVDGLIRSDHIPF